MSGDAAAGRTTDSRYAWARLMVTLGAALLMYELANKLEITGGATKRGIGHRIHAGATLSMRDMTGIVSYNPAEMVMTAKALLDRNPNPSDGEIRQELAYNLCRCGTHVEILKAVRRAAESLKEHQEEHPA